MTQENGSEADLSENESIPNLRDALKASQEKTQELESQLTESTAALKQFQAKETFRSNGYSEAHAELFVKANPEAEINPESIQEFVNAYDLQPQVQEQVSNDGMKNLSSVAQKPTDNVNQIGTAETQQLTKAEYKKLQASDPTAAHEALIQGRVTLRADNVLGDSLNK
tara:strand:- start:191 stop:694 length:504 start_codon:yes stop_codon:yes gene_type:complete